MDKISELSDELLIKILSFLPTKVVVSTSILSKRWECLWMWVPKLKFYCKSSSMSESEDKRLRRFLTRNLPLHRAPVIESLLLDLWSPLFKPEHIKLWVVIALSRYLRNLEIRYDPYSQKPYILPSSLYTSKSLVTLTLSGGIRFDVPRMVCLPSLKTLQLVIHEYLDGESLRRLLSICPVLEDLSVHFERESDDMGLITIKVPSLLRLSVYLLSESGGRFDGLVIDTPSLKSFQLEDLDDWGHSCLIENMPKLEKAYVDVRFSDMKSLIGSITSVKRLTICSKIAFGDGFVFNQLEHLNLCVCTAKTNLLVQLLEDSPYLRVLDIYKMYHFDTHWEDPSSTVNECILPSLKAFNWSRYLGRRPQEKDLAIYVLGKRFSLKDNNLV